MKALSIQQPWASMIALGYKRVENRSWDTKHRGPTLIHAGKSFDAAGWSWIVDNASVLGVPQEALEITPVNFPSGGIIGMVNLHAVTHTDSYRPDGRWFFGPYGFWMKDACKLPFQPLRGQLGFFEVPNE
jgi:hypothetical protein